MRWNGGGKCCFFAVPVPSCFVSQAECQEELWGKKASALYSAASRHERTQTLAMGSEVRTPTAQPLAQSSDHITEVWTYWLIGVWWKAPLTHLKTQRRRFLFVSVAAFKIITKRTARSRRRKLPVRPLCLSQASDFGHGMLAVFFFLRITKIKGFVVGR